mmetsp:Transcript_4167/g.6874  ORF Transcript_4167/g.6874 Transcript_4167/m.6874 type:complete len:329 (-) Transcript_4167:203-1189(-)
MVASVQHDKLLDERLDISLILLEQSCADGLEDGVVLTVCTGCGLAHSLFPCQASWFVHVWAGLIRLKHAIHSHIGVRPADCREHGPVRGHADGQVGLALPPKLPDVGDARHELRVVEVGAQHGGPKGQHGQAVKGHLQQLQHVRDGHGSRLLCTEAAIRDQDAGGIHSGGVWGRGGVERCQQLCVAAAAACALPQVEVPVEPDFILILGRASGPHIAAHRKLRIDEVVGHSEVRVVGPGGQEGGGELGVAVHGSVPKEFGQGPGDDVTQRHGVPRPVPWVAGGRTGEHACKNVEHLQRTRRTARPGRELCGVHLMHVPAVRGQVGSKI